MADHLGYRKKMGTLGPSTNTIVQPDFDDLRPVGVTNHTTAASPSPTTRSMTTPAF